MTANLLVTPGSGVMRSTRRTVPVDGDGRFRVAPLPAGEYLVGVRRVGETGPSSVRPLRKYVDLREGSMGSLVFETVHPGARISGRVIDDRGEPVEGMDIEIYYLEVADFPVPAYIGRGWSDAAGSTVTDEFGEYSCEGVAAGVVGVQAGLKATSKDPERRVLAIGPVRLEVEVPDVPGGEVSVRDIPVVPAHSFVVEGAFEDSSGEPVDCAGMRLAADFATVKIRAHEGWGPQTSPFYEFHERAGRFVLQCDTPSPRVRVELLEGKTGDVLWSKEFDPEPDRCLSDQRYAIEVP